MPPRKFERLQNAFTAMRGQPVAGAPGGRKGEAREPGEDDFRGSGRTRRERREGEEGERPRAAAKPYTPPPPPRPARSKSIQSTFDLLAVCPLGMEMVAAAEMRSHGLQVRSVEPNCGAVEWSGTLNDVMRANLLLRTVERVTLRLDTFRATHFAQLRGKTADLPWEHWVKPGRPVCFRVSADTSKLYHERAIAERVEGGMADRMGGVVRTVRHSEETEGEGAQMIHVRMHKDDCTLSLDTSGARLHRRGYRLAIGKAPLRETLAAALIRHSGWDPATPFADPFCGSGTLPIEAALLARNIAPGLNRKFAFEDWTLFEAGPWKEMIAAARAAIKPTGPLIFASDRDAGAVESAKANAERAGVGADIRFEHKSVSDFAPPPDAPPGLILTNPPYGFRAKGPDLRNLYARFSQVAQRNFPGWKAMFLCTHPAHAHAAGADMNTGIWYNNGGIRVKVLWLK